MKGACARVYTYKQDSVSRGRVLFAEVSITRRNWLWLITDRHLLHTDVFQQLLYDAFHLAIRQHPLPDVESLVSQIDNLLGVFRELPETSEAGYQTMLKVSENSYEVDNFCSSDDFLAESERTHDSVPDREEEHLNSFLARLRDLAVKLGGGSAKDPLTVEELVDAIVLNTFVRYFLLPLHRQTTGRSLLYILQTLKDMSPDLGYHLDLLTQELEFKTGKTLEPTSKT